MKVVAKTFRFDSIIFHHYVHMKFGGVLNLSLLSEDRLYRDLEVLDYIELNGFFVGWPYPPSKEVFKRILRGSYYVVLAIDENKLLGFVNSISGLVLSAYIALLEVLLNYQGKGIGKELVAMLNKLFN